MDGDLVGNGDAHFRAVFRATTIASPQVFALEFGIDPRISTAGDSSSTTVAWTNAVHVVTVVPEPGSALLIGLGLSVLSVRRGGSPRRGRRAD